jgi:hypothetical protein
VRRALRGRERMFSYWRLCQVVSARMKHDVR